MSIQHIPHAHAPLGRDPQVMLFTPGARLGWIFRDRRTLLAPYPEPEPDLEKLREQAAATAAAAAARYARVRRWAGKPSLIAAVVLVLLAGCAKTVNSGADTGRTLLTVLVLCAPGLAWTAVCWYRRDQAGQLNLGPGFGEQGRGGPLPITSSRMGHLLDALGRGYDVLGFGRATAGDEMFRQLVLARIIESAKQAGQPAGAGGSRGPRRVIPGGCGASQGESLHDQDCGQ